MRDSTGLPPDFTTITIDINNISIGILQVKCRKLKMSQILNIPFRSLLIPLLLVSTMLMSACNPDLSGTEPDWTPMIGDCLQIQYVEEPLDLSVEAQVFSVDLFDTSAETIFLLHKRGKKVICYVNTGAWEEYRPDANDFPGTAIGLDYEDWPGEKWLDISSYELFKDIILARFDLAVAKGCDGIDADNMQNYEEETGFDISYADQLAYNLWLSEQAHQRNLAIGLKNDALQTADLLDSVDWSLIEDCHVYGWCELLLPFIHAGKPVFQVEYSDSFRTTDDFCSQSTRLGFSGMLKNRELDAWVDYCP